jgi:hypothetical protein
MVSECERPVGSREQMAFRRIFYTPYWTTFELRSIYVEAASVGILGQIVGGLGWWSLWRSRGGSLRVFRRPALGAAGVGCH